MTVNIFVQLLVAIATSGQDMPKVTTSYATELVSAVPLMGFQG